MSLNELRPALIQARRAARAENRKYFINTERLPWGGIYAHISPFRPIAGRFVEVSPLGSIAWKGL